MEEDDATREVCFQEGDFSKRQLMRAARRKGKFEGGVITLSQSPGGWGGVGE